MAADVLESKVIVQEAGRAVKCARADGEDESRLFIEGALDAVTAREVKPLFDSVVADPPRRVTIDFAKVTLLDSSGVGALVSLFKRIRARGGNLVIAGAHGQPLAVLRLLKLDRVFLE